MLRDLSVKLGRRSERAGPGLLWHPTLPYLIDAFERGELSEIPPPRVTKIQYPSEGSHANDGRALSVSLGPVTTHAHDYGILVGWNSRKLPPPGSRLLSRCRAALSASPLAPCSSPSGLSPRLAAKGAGSRPDVAPGPPLPPAAPLVANRCARPGLCASATRADRAPHAGGPVARPPPRQSPSRRPGGAHTTGPQSLGRSRGGWTPTMHRGAADDRTALVCSRSPGPAPAAPAGRPWRTRRGLPPAPPALLRDRASAGDQTRPLAVARGYVPVGPPRRSRGAPWASARELDKRRTAIARVLRRLQGCRRLCSRCEQLDVLFLGYIVFALTIDTLR